MKTLCTKLLFLFLIAATTTALHAQKPELIVPTGHTSNVSSLKFTPDGRYLVSGCYDRTIKLWDVETGSELRTYAGHTDFITSIDISNDGKYIISASDRDNLRLWDLVTGKQLKSFPGHNASNRNVRFSPDGKSFASCSWDNQTIVWDIETGKKLHVFEGEGDIEAVAFSPDGKNLIYAGSPTRVGAACHIFVADLTSGKIIKNIKTHRSSILSLIYSNDGSKFLSASYDKTMNVFDAKSFKKIITLTGHTGSLMNARFSPDGTKVVSGGKDLTLKIWDVKTGTVLKSIETGHEEIIWSVAASPDGKKVASAGWDALIKLWDMNTGNLILTFKGIGSCINTVSMSSDEKMIVANGGSNTISLWQTENAAMIKSLSGHTGSVQCVTFSPDNRQILSCAADATIKLWDVQDGQEIVSIKSGYSEIFEVKFSPDGTKALSCGLDKETNVPVMKLWDLATSRELMAIKGYNFYMNSVQYSADGKMMLFATGTLSGNAQIRLFNSDNGEIIDTLKGLEYEIESAVFSHDNKYVAAAGWDQEIAIWEIKTRKLIKTIKQKNTITEIAFSPDDKYIISACGNTIYCFDSKTGREQKRFEGHTSSITSLAFTPKGNKIISGSRDGKIKLWDLDKSNEIMSLIAVDDENWAVVSPKGLFDASPQFMNIIHFVRGNELIELEQLKNLYYEPFLFKKSLSSNQEPLRKVKDMADIELNPQIDVTEIAEDGTFKITATNRGGGIGRVVVFLNNKEIIYDARPQKFNADTAKYVFKINIAGNPNLLRGKENKIEVKAFNKDNDVLSRGIVKNYFIAQNKGIEDELPPDIYIVCAGINDYDGNSLDLKFAAKDAQDIAFSLSLAATDLFGKTQTHLYLLTAPLVDEKDKAKFNSETWLIPTRKNIVNTLTEVAKKAKAGDVLILYLAGHGVVLGEEKEDFYYVTQEANSAEDIYSDDNIRNMCTLSSDTMVNLLKNIAAQKQVFIIDACHSGKVAENLIGSRDLNSNAVRAIDRMKDRVGMHILAGSNANQVSYESSRFGQGLLTYSLLEGMKGSALREQKFVDINILFQSARERVPSLASGIGGVQTPVVFSPLGSESFDIGIMTDVSKQNVPLAKSKPVFIKSTFFESESLADVIDLGNQLSDKLVEFNSQGKYAPLIFVESSDFPGSYYFRGIYTIKGNAIKLKANLFKDKELIQTFEQNGQKQNTKALISLLVDNMMKVVK